MHKRYTIPGTSRGKPDIQIDVDFIDFGISKPSQYHSIGINLTNSGGNFDDVISLELQNGDSLFEALFSDPKFPNSVRAVVEFNTYISSLDLLGAHRDTLEIRAGEQTFILNVTGTIIPHT